MDHQFNTAFPYRNTLGYMSLLICSIFSFLFFFAVPCYRKDINSFLFNSYPGFSPPWMTQPSGESGYTVRTQNEWMRRYACSQSATSQAEAFPLIFPALSAYSYVGWNLLFCILPISSIFVASFFFFKVSFFTSFLRVSRAAPDPSSRIRLEPGPRGITDKRAHFL